MRQVFFSESGMKPLRIVFALVAVAALLVVGSAAFSRAHAQMGQSNNPTMNQQRPVMPDMDSLDMPRGYGGDPMRARARERRLAYMNAERQKAMVADANRLVKLVAALNAQVNGEQHSQLTPDQVRQLAEIEKLAHSVREKMSTSVRQTMPYPPPPIFMPPQ